MSWLSQNQDECKDLKISMTLAGKKILQTQKPEIQGIEVPCLSISSFMYMYVFVCPWGCLFVPPNSPYLVGNFPSYAPDRQDGRNHNRVH